MIFKTTALAWQDLPPTQHPLTHILNFPLGATDTTLGQFLTELCKNIEAKQGTVEIQLRGSAVRWITETATQSESKGAWKVTPQRTPPPPPNDIDLTLVINTTNTYFVGFAQDVLPKGLATDMPCIQAGPHYINILQFTLPGPLPIEISLVPCLFGGQKFQDLAPPHSCPHEDSFVSIHLDAPGTQSQVMHLETKTVHHFAEHNNYFFTSHPEAIQHLFYRMILNIIKHGLTPLPGIARFATQQRAEKVKENVWDFHKFLDKHFPLGPNRQLAIRTIMDVLHQQGLPNETIQQIRTSHDFVGDYNPPLTTLRPAMYKWYAKQFREQAKSPEILDRLAVDLSLLEGQKFTTEEAQAFIQRQITPPALPVTKAPILGSPPPESTGAKHTPSPPDESSKSHTTHRRKKKEKPKKETLAPAEPPRPKSPPPPLDLPTVAFKATHVSRKSAAHPKPKAAQAAPGINWAKKAAQSSEEVFTAEFSKLSPDDQTKALEQPTKDGIPLISYLIQKGSSVDFFQKFQAVLPLTCLDTTGKTPLMYAILSQAGPQKPPLMEFFLVQTQALATTDIQGKNCIEHQDTQDMSALDHATATDWNIATAMMTAFPHLDDSRVPTHLITAIHNEHKGIKNKDEQRILVKAAFTKLLNTFCAMRVFTKVFQGNFPLPINPNCYVKALELDHIEVLLVIIQARIVPSSAVFIQIFDRYRTLQAQSNDPTTQLLAIGGAIDAIAKRFPENLPPAEARPPLFYFSEKIADWAKKVDALPKITATDLPPPHPIAPISPPIKFNGLFFVPNVLAWPWQDLQAQIHGFLQLLPHLATDVNTLITPKTKILTWIFNMAQQFYPHIQLWSHHNPSLKPLHDLIYELKHHSDLIIHTEALGLPPNMLGYEEKLRALTQHCTIYTATPSSENQAVLELAITQFQTEILIIESTSPTPAIKMIKLLLNGISDAISTPESPQIRVLEWHIARLNFILCCNKFYPGLRDDPAAFTQFCGQIRATGERVVEGAIKKILGFPLTGADRVEVALLQ